MRFLRMIFTWWHHCTVGTAFFTWKRGKLVGLDTQGNRYYVDKAGRVINSKIRRWVIFNGDIEASRVPAEWHGWLHYTVDDIPNDDMIRKKWQRSHQMNMTGMKLVDHDQKDTSNQPSSSDYIAWKP